MKKWLKYFSALVFVCLTPATVLSQVYLNRPVVLSGEGDSAKIENVFTPADTSAGVNVSTLQQNTYRYTTVTGINNLIVSNPTGLTQPVKGMVIFFKAAAANTDSVYLSLDGITFYPLYKKVSYALSAGDIGANYVVAAAFDGTNFQYLNYSGSNCPTGFIAVTDEYCIEANESAATTPYWDAINDCYSRNARMCNWGEWHYACVSLGTSLSNMTNNWEYTDDAGNEVNFVRIVGSGSCTAAGNQNIPVNLPKNYRCCYSRK